jgi:addiction module RelB/DinJ family antitoxin
MGYINQHTEVNTMAKTSSMYIRVDPEIKAEVEDIYARLGISLTQAITTFLYQSRYVGGFPFDVLQVPSSSPDLRGKYKGVLSTDSFMAQKQREKELEA